MKRFLNAVVPLRDAGRRRAVARYRSRSLRASMVIGSAFCLMGAMAPSAAADGAPLFAQSLTYTGKVQTLTVPSGVTRALITATGGGGGVDHANFGDFQGGQGGQAARLSGSLAVIPGETFSIAVGGGGQVGDKPIYCTKDPSGGWSVINGIDYSGGDGFSKQLEYCSGGGGGATVVSRDRDNATIMVAGGGGGAGDGGDGGSADPSFLWDCCWAPGGGGGASGNQSTPHGAHGQYDSVIHATSGGGGGGARGGSPGSSGYGGGPGSSMVSPSVDRVVRQAAGVNSIGKPGQVTVTWLSNLAAGKSTWASSTIEGNGWSTGNLTDGQVSSTPVDQGYSSDTSATQSIYLDLGTVRAIDDVTLYPRTDTTGLITGFTGAGFPATFSIEVSKDMLTWAPLSSASPTGYSGQSADDGKPRTYATSDVPVIARYVKLTATTLGKGAPDEPLNHRLQLAEIQVLGQSLGFVGQML